MLFLLPTSLFILFSEFPKNIHVAYRYFLFYEERVNRISKGIVLKRIYESVIVPTLIHVSELWV